MDLTVKIVRICGKCPVYEGGDTFSIREGYKLESKIPVCMHSTEGGAVTMEIVKNE